MSESKTGSLIVFEHDTLLGDIIKSGTPVDAIVSRELIGNIFYNALRCMTEPRLSATAG